MTDWETELFIQERQQAVTAYRQTDSYRSLVNRQARRYSQKYRARCFVIVEQQISRWEHSPGEWYRASWAQTYRDIFDQLNPYGVHDKEPITITDA